MKYFGVLSLLSVLFTLVVQRSEPSNTSASTGSGSESAHWAFQPLTPADPPAVENVSWVRTPIDRFILAKLEAAGLSLMPPAVRGSLIRRVTLDLTGLPPIPEDVEAFVHDESADAYGKLIDRLLGSSAYGERWAQHWLDLARFAETDGFEHDLVRPNAWRYRDWVIDALNRDIPYDEFVRMQIAGDELVVRASARSSTDHGPNNDGLKPALRTGTVATGFLLCGPDMPDINLQEERRHNVLNEMTATIGSVFLGLQLGCAQCHDHKFDPITLADFYGMRAFFEPAEFFDEAPLATPEELAERERLEAPLKVERERIEKELKVFDAMAHERLNKDPQVKISREELVSALSETEREQYKKLADELKHVNDTKLPLLPMGRVMREKGGTPRPSHVMLRGDFRQPGPQVGPAFLRIANPWGDVPEGILRDVRAPLTPALSPGGRGSKSSGRRTALARWLTRPDHPLTTRVIVNRLWQWHFGRGLVRTPSDFGKMGEAPTHPELLDWLATELPRQGWSLKRMHKLILTSATYMQASRAIPARRDGTAEQRGAAAESGRRSREVDPDNRLLARMNRQRLDGESIRDAMLAASERLSQSRGGEGVRPPLPDELVSTLLQGQWTVSPDEEDHRRRSVYVFVRRNLRYPILDVFDRPDTNASCPQRNRSTTAPQSLTMLNSEFALSAARDLAGFVLTRVGSDRTAQIDLSYHRALARRPTADELAAAAMFLNNQTARLTREGRRMSEIALPPEPLPEGVDPFDAAALTDLCLALFNLNEFIYID